MSVWVSQSERKTYSLTSLHSGASEADITVMVDTHWPSCCDLVAKRYVEVQVVHAKIRSRLCKLTLSSSHVRDNVHMHIEVNTSPLLSLTDEF